MDQHQIANQAIPLDYGDEVPLAFGYLPINAKLNQEMFERARLRAIKTNPPHKQDK